MEIKEKFVNTAMYIGDRLKANAPEILTTGGVIGLIAAGVVACINTRKLDKTMEEGISKVNEDKEVAQTALLEEDYDTANEVSKEVIKDYIKLAGNVTKLYVIPVGMAALSAYGVFKGKAIYKDRLNTAITVASSALVALDQMSERIKAKYGEEEYLKLRYGTENVETQVTDKKGNVKTVVEEKPSNNRFNSTFERLFDQSCDGWTKNPVTNRTYLEITREQFQKKLDRRGYLFWNEVLTYFQLPESKVGQMYGWLKGDTISFGLEKTENMSESKASFLRGDETNVWLTFNCNPEPILDKLPWRAN